LWCYILFRWIHSSITLMLSGGEKGRALAIYYSGRIFDGYFILYSFPWEKMFHVSVFIIIITTNESFHPEKLCRGRHLKRKKKFFSRPFRNRHRRVYKKLKKMKLKKKRAERSGREWTCRLRRDEWLPQDSKYIKQLLLFYFVNTLYLSSLYNSVTLFFLPKKVLFIFRHQKTVKREETIIKRRRRRRKHILKTKGDFCARGFFQISTDEKRKFSCPSYSLFVSNLKRVRHLNLKFLRLDDIICTFQM
jgi:hypothetical protein